MLSLPDEQRGEKVRLQLMDVAPTVLKLLNIQIPADFEGASAI